MKRRRASAAVRAPGCARESPEPRSPDSARSRESLCRASASGRREQPPSPVERFVPGEPPDNHLTRTCRVRCPPIILDRERAGLCRKRLQWRSIAQRGLGLPQPVGGVVRLSREDLSRARGDACNSHRLVGFFGVSVCPDASRRLNVRRGAMSWNVSASLSAALARRCCTALIVSPFSIAR